MTDLLDAYTIRARLFPAVLAIAPTLALFLLAASWTGSGLPEIVAGVAIAVLFFAAADLARRMGKRKEQKIFAKTNGRPFNPQLSRADQTFDAGTKDRYRAFIASKLGKTAPSAEEEAAKPHEADAFYVECYNWLRARTYDHGKFGVLFAENINYGFRRNLLGLKPFGIALNALTVAAAVSIVWFKPDFAELSTGKLVAFGALAFTHMLYFIFGVTERSVLSASETYGRQLTVSCEMLMGD